MTLRDESTQVETERYPDYLLKDKTVAELDTLCWNGTTTSMVSDCPANSSDYDDYAVYQFPMEGCDITSSYTLIKGQTFVLKEGCSNLYPATVTGVVGCPPDAPPPEPLPVQVIGDPHMVSVRGEKFDVNQPGGYTLLRIPADRGLPAKLELNASLREAASGSPCGLYVQEVRLSGAWLEGKVVSVQPLQRDVPGSNGAGSGTLHPFSLRVEGGAHGATGDYQAWGSNGTILSDRIVVVPTWRQSYADSGLVKEAEAFRFKIRSDEMAKEHTSVEVSQASHQALDIKVFNLQGLGFQQIGGLLGTEGHDTQIEQFTSACAALRGKDRLAGQPDLAPTVGAYWGESV